MKKHLLLFIIIVLTQGWLLANHWTPVSAPYANNMNMTAVIQIDGTEQQSTTLELGVFCGDECRGSQQPTLFPPTQRYVVQVTVFGEIGDQLSFKLYDHGTGQELDLVSPNAVSFTADGYGSLGNPFVLAFTSPAPGPGSDDVVIELYPGWNWISYLPRTQMTIEEAFANLTPSDGDLVKSQMSYSIYNADTGEWEGNLRSFQVGRGIIYQNNSNVTRSFSYPGELRTEN